MLGKHYTTVIANAPVIATTSEATYMKPITMVQLLYMKPYLFNILFDSFTIIAVALIILIASTVATTLLKLKLNIL